MREIKAVSTKKGNHIHMEIYMACGKIERAAERHVAAYCGALVLEIEEWKTLVDVLMMRECAEDVRVLIEGWKPGEGYV